jgi:hypothetical protein
MKNKILFDSLKNFEFKETINLTLIQEIRQGYNVAVEFSEDSDTIVVANFYCNPKDNNDSPRRYVVFSGFCNSIELFVNLIQIINIENKARSIINHKFVY